MSSVLPTRKLVAKHYINSAMCTEGTCRTYHIRRALVMLVVAAFLRERGHRHLVLSLHEMQHTDAGARRESCQP